MPRTSEFSSYTFIKNDLQALGWTTKNPTRDPRGQVYTQQECLDHMELKKGLQRQRPEFTVKIAEDSYWIIEAKGNINNIGEAFTEAVAYAYDINRNTSLVRVKIVSGVAGNDIDGYIIKTAYMQANNGYKEIEYNDIPITGLLSPQQALYVSTNETNLLNELVSDEEFLLRTAEDINEILHKASINKDKRASVMSSVLLSMISDTLPNFNASPQVFIRDINNRAEDTLIENSKREFAAEIELKIPGEEASAAKLKQALVQVFFKLRKINVKAAMNGGQDLLGKFYEVFLKYGNGAKDIGIVLTPRHITKFGCDILQVNDEDVVYDPACGTGGFLVAAYDRVRNLNMNDLTHFKKHRIFGVEQQANVAALAIVNMIFRGDGKNNIINDDCFAINLNRKIRNGSISAEYTDDNPDRPPVTKVLMNPPFALKKEDEKEHKFIDHALKQMARGGVLLAVLPASVMYGGKENLKWRQRMLSSNQLVAVVSFSPELFYPQVAVQTVITIIRKGSPHRPDDAIAWARVTDDGYYKIKKRRLPTGNTDEIDIIETSLAGFINEGITENVILNTLEYKPISSNDTKLELVPENYLSSPEINTQALSHEVRRIMTEVTIQGLRKYMNDEN